MSNHKSERSMMFFFLERINYNQSWEGVELDMSYDLGDFVFKSRDTSEKIKRLAKQMWMEINGYFNEDGN